MKKRFPLFIGLTLVTGIVSSWALSRKQPPIKNYYEDFIGKWRYQKDSQKADVILSVTPDYQLFFLDRLEPVSIVELSSQRLVFLDQMGYHIIFEKNGNQLTFYDETEGRAYPLEALTE